MGMNRTFKAAVAALMPAVGLAVLVALEFPEWLAAGQPLEDGVAIDEKFDYATAVGLFRPSAEQGDADAQRFLAVSYMTGLGVPQDHAVAVSWYRKAAEQGDAAAQYQLGLMYLIGQGVPQDHAVAVSWYRKAADQGDAGAQSILGSMYEDGLGVPQDYVIALMWLNLAAVSDALSSDPDEDAVRSRRKERDIVAKQMTPAQIAEAQKLAREWKPK
jgi:TPR repeat protein